MLWRLFTSLASYLALGNITVMKYLAILLIMFSSFSSQADIGVFVSGGQVTGKLATQASRHGIVWRSETAIWHHKDNPITWEVEAAYSHWNNQYFPAIDVISITPVFHYNFQLFNLDAYAGGGIGVAKLSGDQLSSRDLGSELLFDDKLVFGVNWQQTHRLSIAWHHYSNANLASSNDGSSFIYAAYSFFF